MTDMTRARAFPERHFPAQGRALSSSGIIPPVNKLIALPFDAGGTFDAISTLVKWAGSQDSVMRLGVYGSDANGLPGTLIYGTGEIETSSNNVFVVEPLDEARVFDTPFWVVALFGGETPPTMLAAAALSAFEMQHVFGISSSGIQASIFNAAANNAVLADYSYDVLPETFPAGVISGSSLWLAVKTPA